MNSKYIGIMSALINGSFKVVIENRIRGGLFLIQWIFWSLTFHPRDIFLPFEFSKRIDRSWSLIECFSAKLS